MKALVTGLFCAAILACTAHAQSNTSKIIVPFAPGGGQDVLARVLAPELAAQLGESFIIENRAGGGGSAGSTLVARSAPDGKTLVMAASSHTISAVLDRKSPYDPVKDFTAVAHIGSGAYIMLVSATVKAANVAELISYAKANPGKMNYASAGVGSATHLAAAYFASRAGIDVVHVPFKSTAEALNALMQGETQLLIVPTLGSQAFIGNPQLRLLAVVSPVRIPTLPNVPTVIESGLPGFEFSSWFGLLGPANMPADVTRRLNAAVNKVLAIPNIVAAIEKQGIEPRALDHAQFTKLLSENLESTKELVKAAGIVNN
jgi:tripartite-type tricarboxylate transporter receptor subunit TctC